MRRTLRLAVFAASALALAACSSPTAPSRAACLNAKIPYASCPNADYVNPAGDYVNPAGDYVNPAGNVISPSD